MSFGSGISKRGRPGKPAAADFVETRASTEDRLAARRLAMMKNTKNSPLLDIAGAENQSTYETETHDSATQDASQKFAPNDSIESLISLDTLKLAAELQQFAFRETETPINPDNKGKGLPSLKVQPRPPKPHRCVPEEEVVASVHHTGDEDYVYDTYMQFKAQSDDQGWKGQPTPLHGLLQGLPPDSVGILVVAEEDQATWETLIDNDAGNKDHDNEDEDENGECLIRFVSK